MNDLCRPGRPRGGYTPLPSISDGWYKGLYIQGIEGGLYIGGLQFLVIKDGVPCELLSVFTDDMYCARVTDTVVAAFTDGSDAAVTAHEFTAPGPVIASRLDILGVTPALRRQGARPVRREGEREGRWVLLDYLDLVIHVQLEDERIFYALERLWKDCPQVPLSEPVGATDARDNR